MWEVELNIDDFFVINATIHNPDTGGAIDADSAPTYDIYEDVTDLAVATGTLNKLDDDSTLGLYAKRVQALIATYSVGKTYTVVVQAIVDGVPGNKAYSFIVRDTIANRVWKALTSALTTAGSIGKLLADFVDAAISSRATPADILNAAAEGVIQSNFPVIDGGTQRIPRGDVATITLIAGTNWDLSGGERVFFAMKTNKFDGLGNASAKVNREATIVQANPLVATFTFTSEESDAADLYDAEFEQRDADGVSNPLTITRDLKVLVFEDVRK